MNKPSVKKKWYLCPHCRSKMILYDNTASSHGVFAICTRGCKNEVEITIRNGEQIDSVTGKPIFGNVVAKF